MRYKVLLLIIATLVTVGAAILTTSRSAAVMSQAQTALAGEINKHINGQVTFSRLEIHSFRSASLYDVLILDASGHRVASAARATAYFDLWSALTGQVAVAAIKELELLGPELTLVRQADGRWNTENLLLSQGNEDETACSAVITVMHGTIRLLTAGKEYILTDLNGSANLAHRPRMDFSLAGAYQGERVAAEGTLKNKEDFFVRVKTARMALPALQPLLPPNGAVVLHDGKLTDVTLTLRQQQGQLSYAGEAAVNEAAVDIGGVSIVEGQGRLTVTNQNLYLYQAQGKAAGQPVTVQGRITLNTSEPVLDLTAESQELDGTALHPAFPLDGKAAVKAHITGRVSNPSVDGTVYVAQGSMAGIPVSGLQARAQLTDNIVTVSEVKAAALGGALQGSGQLDLISRRYQARLYGTGIDSAAVPAVPAGTAGQADFAIIANGQGTELATLSGTVAITAARLSGVQADQVNAGFYWTGQSTVLDFINIQAGTGTLSARGALTGDKLQLTLAGQSIPLDRLAGLAPIPLAGQADVAGTVSGTLDNPVASLQVAAKDGQVWEQPFAAADGQLIITKDALTFHQVTARSGPTVHIVNGSVGLSGDKLLQLSISTKAARAETIIGLIMPGEKLTGNVDNEVIISGPLADWNMTGKIKLWDGSFREQLISRAEGEYRRSQGVTTLENFIVQSLNAEVRMAGTISAANEMDIAVTAKDLELAKFQVSDSYPMSGKASFVGHLGGTVAEPSFDGKLTADKIRLNGQDVSNIDGVVRTVGSRIHIEHFGFTQSGGSFAFTGGLEQHNNSIYGTVTVTNGQLGSLLAILNSPVKEIEGKLNGYIEIGGTLHKPDIAVKGNLLAGKVKNYPLDSIDIDVDLTDGIVHVNTFFARQGAGILAARGTADLKGPIALEIGGRDMDAGLLTAWFDSGIETNGKLTFSAEVNGKTMDPQAALSLQIANGQVANAGFDELYGLFMINKGSIHVNQVMLLKGPYKASAYGVIPVAALSKEGRAKGTIADQMNLSVTLDKGNLSILPLLTKEVAWAAGETKGQIQLGGTLYRPAVHGRFLVQDGTIKLKSLSQPIQKVAVDIQFEGDTMNIKSFSGHMGGGSYDLSGRAGWQGLALADYNFTLALNNLGVDHRYFKGPLQGMLRLAEKDGKPCLSGKLLFENNTVNIPLLPEFSETDADVALDLEIVAGKKVRLYNSYLYDVIVEGKAKFGGTTRQPSSTGRISAVRGTVSYLRTPFKIKDAAADFTQFGSFIPMIHLEASTRLEQTTVNLGIHGPLQAMEMRLTAEPAMSQQQILSLLTLRSRYFEKSKSGGAGDTGLGRDEVISLLDAGLQMRFISEMEGAFRNAFGLDEFRVVRGTLSAERTDSLGKTAYDKESPFNREVYNIEFGKYVTDRLMLNYTMGIDHQERIMGFRYDLSRRISFTGSWDNNNKSRLGLETRFTF